MHMGARARQCLLLPRAPWVSRGLCQGYSVLARSCKFGTLWPCCGPRCRPSSTAPAKAHAQCACLCAPPSTTEHWAAMSCLKAPSCNDFTQRDAGPHYLQRQVRAVAVLPHAPPQLVHHHSSHRVLAPRMRAQVCVAPMHATCWCTAYATYTKSTAVLRRARTVMH